MSDKQACVERIMTAWIEGDVDGVLNELCEDVEYHFLMGERPLIGREWVRRFLVRFGAGMHDNRWRLLRAAETDNALLVEGVDDYRDGEGRHVLYPYMGVFEFRDGKISHWRDYADKGLMARVKEGGELPVWLEALVG